MLRCFDFSYMQELRDSAQFACKNHGFTAANKPKGREGTDHRGHVNSSMFDTRSETSQLTTVSQGDVSTAPPPLTVPNSFSWVKKRKDSTYNQPSSISQLSDPNSASFTFSNTSILNLIKQENEDVYTDSWEQKQQRTGLNRHDFSDLTDQQAQNKFDRSGFFDACDVSHQEEVSAANNNMVRSQAT